MQGECPEKETKEVNAGGIIHRVNKQSEGRSLFSYFPGFDDKSTGEERNAAVIALLWFFLVITAYYVLKPIRESLALELGSGNIPSLNILSMFSLVIANALYSWIVGKFKRERFISWITCFFIACLIGFAVIFNFTPSSGQLPGEIAQGRKIAITAYFIWVNIFGLFSVSLFWSFINDVFTQEQSCRLFPIIGYGGLIGGLSGGIITTLLAKIVGTTNLFIISAILLVPTIRFMRRISDLSAGFPNRVLSGNGTSIAETHKENPAVRPWDGLVKTFSSPLLFLMACEMFLYTFGSTIFSYQITVLLERTYSTTDERTVFASNVYTSMNALSLITQSQITFRMMKLARPFRGLLLLPIIQLAGSALLIRYPFLLIASVVYVIRYALNYSTGRCLRELMYTPLHADVKYQSKGFIDTLVFRAGDGCGSLFLLYGLKYLGEGHWVSLTVMGTMLISACTIMHLALKFDPKKTVN